MQTFLPYANLAKSAKCLDNKRLGKQRVEVLQILDALKNGGRWRNHPAVKMWRDYEYYLAAYGVVVCKEWIKRGFKDTCLDKLKNRYPLLFDNLLSLLECGEGFKPYWLGYKQFHDSHKSNLLRKKPEWYGQFNWNVPNNLPYVWPVK